MTTLVVIPARMASTRFPGKPLVDLCGKPMIQWVVEAARRADVGDVVVATPDEEIAAACRTFGVEAIMTRLDHPSGTDRIAEVSESLVADVYVNVQGDEPLIPPETIHACATPLLTSAPQTSNLELHTPPSMEPPDACAGVRSDSAPAPYMSSCYSDCPTDEADNPAVVKVVTDESGDAMYFSRYPIPYPRNARSAPLKKHVGIYAYRREVVQAFARWPQTPLEMAEGLEQLRFLEHGIRIRMSQVPPAALAVDTPAQAAQVRRILNSLSH